MDLLTVGIVFIFVLVVLKLSELYLRTIYLQDLQKRCVLVTGCDSGFGHLLAQELDMKGVRVFAGCLTGDGQRALTEKCSSNAVIFRLDVTNEDSIRNAVHVVKSKLKHNQVLWGLVNNAGVLLLRAPIEWQTKELYEKTLAVNLYGVIEMTRAFLPLLRQSQGRVVNMSSITAMLAIGKLAPYNISKAGVESFTDTLRKEMYHIGVTAHLIQPSGFATSINSKRKEYSQKAVENLPQEVKDFYGVEDERLVVGVRVDQDLAKVTKLIRHALFARFPKYRYPVGPGAVAIFWTLSHFPEIVPDRLLAMKKPGNYTCT